MGNYKIMRVSWCRFPGLVPECLSARVCDKLDLDYESRLRRFLDFKVVYFNGFAREMEALGNQAQEVISDCHHLQKRWAIENGVKFMNLDQHWQTDILLSQIETSRPDVLYLQMGPYALPVAVRRKLKVLFPFIKLVLVSQAVMGFWADYEDIDALFAGSPALHIAAREHGVHSRLVYHCFDPDVVADRQNGTGEGRGDPRDLTFTGYSGWNEGSAYVSRYWILARLMRDMGLQAWLLEREDRGWHSFLTQSKSGRVRDLLMGLCVRGGGLLFRRADTSMKDELWDARLALAERKRIRADWDRAVEGDPRVPLGHLFPGNCHPPLFGLDMYGLLSSSRISLNVHGDVKRGTVDNIRMFDATGVGSCLLTDTGSNMHELFEPDSEVVTYESIEECVEKAAYLLEHESECREIAARGQARTLKDHTIRQRVEQIDEEIKRLL